MSAYSMRTWNRARGERCEGGIEGRRSERICGSVSSFLRYSERYSASSEYHLPSIDLILVPQGKETLVKVLDGCVSLMSHKAAD